MRTKKIQAFTITELMMVVAILAIIASIAAPSFVSMIRENTARTQANELLALTNYARSEAIKRQSNIQVTITSLGTAGWKAQVLSNNELLKEMDKTSSVVSVSAANLGFDIRGRRVGTDNCVSVSYSSYIKQLQVGLGGNLKVINGSCS
ncbi:GspH/FimT family pseudopilin [Shewanella avicenniae]|uniref:Type II secretion system protein H n=1 Tax=Shewanella avicenniae TaxID=2814294 RepID=A0ABX7QP93_9GAMM|nr:GspH/FimT family pseudopilin [Shewanella avicenniae]QSX33299.1 GspH/FimT family pseudopilin [Shewanella avicenniae]